LETPNGGNGCARSATARSRSSRSCGEAEKLQAQGLTIPQSCKRLGISDQTFYRWRIKYGALKEDEAQRLKALEQENSRLKKIVAEQALDISMLKDLQRGKW
jgi:putative transposase